MGRFAPRSRGHCPDFPGARPMRRTPATPSVAMVRSARTRSFDSRDLQLSGSARSARFSGAARRPAFLRRRVAVRTSHPASLPAPGCGPASPQSGNARSPGPDDRRPLLDTLELGTMVQIDLPSRRFEPRFYGVGAWTSHLHLAYDLAAV